MKNYDVAVIGGSAAGIPAAITARRHYPEKSIVVIRKEEKVSIPCGIPYVFGTVMSTDKNLIPDTSLSGNGIDLIVSEATSLDCASKTVGLANGETVAYDKLILSTGSMPLVPPIPGSDKEGVFSVQKDVVYLDNMLQYLENVKNVVVVGGGFIGVEFADELRKRGLNVTIVEMLPYCLMLALDESYCKEAEEKLESLELNVRTRSKLTEILGNSKVTGVKLENGDVIDADMVLIGIGVKPNVTLAEQAGLENNKGGIVVDSYMRTSDDSVFACGDCTSKVSFFTGKYSPLKLASIATMEARVAGANLYKISREQHGVIGVFSTIIDNQVFGVAGLGEKRAREIGYDIACGEIEQPNRHPGGMPGMTLLKVKLIFNKVNRELLGGCVRGGDSAGETINTISACIQKKMTADEIAMFQLGTHPAVTASPISYQLVNAAEIAIQAMN